MAAFNPSVVMLTLYVSLENTLVVKSPEIVLDCKRYFVLPEFPLAPQVTVMLLLPTLLYVLATIAGALLKVLVLPKSVYALKFPSLLNAAARK